MGDVLVQRIVDLTAEAEAVLGIPLVDLFINDHIDGENTRQYSDLFLFTEHHCVQIRNFPNGDTLDIDLINRSIANVVINKVAFDYVATRPDSRMSVNYSTAAHMGASFSASRENCMKLMEIVRTRIVPNFYGGGNSPEDSS